MIENKAVIIRLRNAQVRSRTHTHHRDLYDTHEHTFQMHAPFKHIQINTYIMWISSDAALVLRIIPTLRNLYLIGPCAETKLHHRPLRKIVELDD